MEPYLLHPCSRTQPTNIKKPYAPVGWVERSETQQTYQPEPSLLPAKALGFAALNPAYRAVSMPLRDGFLLLAEGGYQRVKQASGNGDHLGGGIVGHFKFHQIGCFFVEVDT